MRKNSAKHLRMKDIGKEKIHRSVLFLSGYRCCLCRQPEVQIHHIDGNPSNNVPENIAPLCVSHHNQAEHGKSKDLSTLSIKLTPSEVQLGKQMSENIQARMLGFKNVEEFWRDVEGAQSVVYPDPKYHAIAFRDLETWYKLKDCVAALNNNPKKRYHIFLINKNSELWVAVAAAIPGEHIKHPIGWRRRSGYWVIPFKKEEKKCLPLTSFSFIDQKHQKRLMLSIQNELERIDIFNSLGVYLEIRINGPQPWPDNSKELQLAVWLQNLSCLQFYLGLLEPIAGNWHQLAQRISFMRGANQLADKNAISSIDAALVERVVMLQNLIRGKAIALKPLMVDSIKYGLRLSFADFLKNLEDAEKLQKVWTNLIQVIRDCIASICSPERLEAVFNYPNPILCCLSAYSYDDGQFKMPGRTIIDFAQITNTEHSHIQAREDDGKCNLNITYQNELRLTIRPKQRPGDSDQWVEEIQKLGIKALLNLQRQGKLGGQ